MATREELLCRLEALFADEEPDDKSLETYTFEQVLEGIYPKDKAFIVKMPPDMNSDQEMSAKEKLSVWLDTANPAFGNECPKTYLDSDDQAKLDYLDGILGAIEYGAFA